MITHKDGRRNRYQIQAHLPVPEPGTREPAVGEVVALFAARHRTGTRPRIPRVTTMPPTPASRFPQGSDLGSAVRSDGGLNAGTLLEGEWLGLSRMIRTGQCA